MSHLPVYEGWSQTMANSEYENSIWSDLKVVPHKTMSIHPAAMGVQFGASVFEGYKIHRTSDSNANTFRLADNYQRMLRSCDRLCIPCPEYSLYFKAMELIASQVESWRVPFQSDWLYVRPIIVSIDEHIMPVVSSRYNFYLLTAPIRPFQVETFNLWIENKFSRAASGGLGTAKTGANYAHQYYPTQQAKMHGCDAVLWLDSNKHSEIEECSTMNVFFRVGDEIFTPSLKDTILPGITRKSVISIMKSENWKVDEREMSINQILNWIKDGLLNEIFVTSTALGVRTVNNISYNNIQYKSSFDTILSDHLRETLHNIYQGKSDEYGDWIVPINMVDA